MDDPRRKNYLLPVNNLGAAHKASPGTGLNAGLAQRQLIGAIERLAKAERGE
jgi:hypothetical protein